MVLPTFLLDHRVGRRQTDSAIPTFAVCLQGDSSSLGVQLKLHLRHIRGSLTVLPLLCADLARIVERSAPWEVEE